MRHSAVWRHSSQDRSVVIASDDLYRPSRGGPVNCGCDRAFAVRRENAFPERGRGSPSLIN
jgi:hypothetical protein